MFINHLNTSNAQLNNLHRARLPKLTFLITAFGSMLVGVAQKCLHAYRKINSYTMHSVDGDSV